MGIIMLYMILFGLFMVVTVEATPEAGLYNSVFSIPIPSGWLNVAPSGYQSMVTIGALDLFTIVWNLGNMAFLRFPPLMQGVYNWFWLIFCLPLAISFWVSVGTILRGVHAG